MSDWDKILHMVIVGITVYASLVFMLRVSGKQTLSKWNSFDFVVTVAFGSTLATTLLDETVALRQSLIAFALLIMLQFVITFISVRSSAFEKLIKAKPVILLYKGRFIEAKLKRERISKSEVMAAVRNRGFSNLEQVEAVVLETNGSLSVIHAIDPNHPATALEGVEHDEASTG